MSVSGRRACAQIVLWLLLLVATPIASAQSDDEVRFQAKAAFDRGVADYSAGRYEQALGSFEEAYRIRPHPLVYVNIANCYDKLGRSVQALEDFQRFLESQTGSQEQRDEVRNAIQRLNQQVGKVLLRISPDGAAVRLDQGELRTAPIAEPIALEAGKHTLTVSSEGYRTSERALIVKGGTTLELTVALEREGAPLLAVVPTAPAPAETAPATPAPQPAAPVTAPPAQPQPQPQPQAPEPAPEPQAGMPVAVWIVGGVTLALAAAATITGVSALGANKDFKQYKAQYVMDSTDPAMTAFDRVAAYKKTTDAADRARSLALATDILLGAGAVGAVVTVYLLAKHGAAKQEEEQAAIELAPFAMAHGAGLALQSGF